MTWQATYAERFNARAIERPLREPVPPPYVRPTDEEIAAIEDPGARLAVALGRAGWDAMAPLREAGAAIVQAMAEQQRREAG